jgi:hypothetical protein
MPDAVDVVAVGEEYERLRERVTAGAGPWWPLGWAVLAGRGMAAWLSARHCGTGRRAGADGTAQNIVPNVPTPPAGLEPQIAVVVRVLADIALAHLTRAPA